MARFCYYITVGHRPVYDQTRYMEKLFVDELKEIYGAEKHQAIFLPLLKKAASSLRLQNMLANHLYTTREHVSRLKDIFKLLGVLPQARRSETLLGVGRQAETVIGTTGKGTSARDAGLVMAAQKLERYKISSYGKLAKLARSLEYDDVLEILEMILYEEKEADDLLTALAEKYINTEAGRK